ncbi:DAO domain-containing protein, partial [Nephila pilipes]
MKFYHPVGTIVTAERDTCCLYDLLQGLETHGVSFIDMSDGEDLRTRFPFLHLDECDYPIFDDDGAGYINCRRIVEAQKRVAQLQGCHIVEDIVDEVTDLMFGVHEVITKRRTKIKAKRVLLCTGAFTHFKKFRPLRRLKMVVNKETVVFLRIPCIEKIRLGSMPTLLMYRDGLADMPTKGAYILPPIQYPD